MPHMSWTHPGTHPRTPWCFKKSSCTATSASILFLHVKLVKCIPLHASGQISPRSNPVIWIGLPLPRCALYILKSVFTNQNTGNLLISCLKEIRPNPDFGSWWMKITQRNNIIYNWLVSQAQFISNCFLHWKWYYQPKSNGMNVRWRRKQKWLHCEI